MIESGGLTIVIPVTERHGDMPVLLTSYVEALSPTCSELQFVVLLDGQYDFLAEKIASTDMKGHDVEIVRMARTIGESAILGVGFGKARHDLVLTLPAYAQIDESYLPKLIEAAGSADMVVARRWPRRDSRFNRISSSIFHGILRKMTGVSFRDLGCGVRLMRRQVIDEIAIYGDQHRFLSLLADRRGFSVVEVDIPQADEDRNTRIYPVSTYLSRLLDLLTVFFVVRFTKKPLRFFGVLGSLLITVGCAILLVAIFQRFFVDIPLADRPILLLGSLLFVLGVQLFALGLIGELIIFTHARELKEYTVAEKINMDDV